jgi:fructuronate reductase
VSLNSTTAKDTLGPQDGLYTLKIMNEPASYHIIGSVKEVLAGPQDHAAVIARIASPDIRIVTLTITEKGYALRADGTLDFSHEGIAADLASGGVPVTALGILAAALALRFKNKMPGLTIISCDNISGNGHKLRGAMLAFSERKDPALAGWIKANVNFPNTMVDSITPASDEGLIEGIAAAIGLTDKAPVHRERFTDWVIEEFDGPRPDWEKAGAVFAPDVTPYEMTKLRLVNAPHSALTYLGLISGHETVAQAMADDRLADYFHRLSRQELIPSLGESPLIDLPHYSDRIAARFANISIHHELFQIATDGSAKLPQRFLPPLALNFQDGRPTGCITLAIAAWMFYVLDTVRRRAVLNDPLKDAIRNIAAKSSGTAQDDVDRMLALEEIFPKLTGNERKIRDEIILAYDQLSIGGAPYALAQMKQNGDP